MADGTVYIDTEIDSDGFGEAFESYSKDVKKTANELYELTKKQREVSETHKKNTAEVEKTSEALDKLIEKQIRYTETGGKTDNRTFAQMEYDIEKASAALDSAKAKQEETSKTLADLNSSVETTRAKLQELTTQESNTSQNSQMLQNTVNSIKRSFKNLFPNLAKATKQMAQFAGKSVINGIKSLGSKIKQMGKSMLTLKKNTGGTQNSLTKMIGAAFGIRTLYNAIRKAVEFVKEGMTNLVQYSGETNESMSSLKSSLTQLKNSLATAFAPILNAIAPILTQFIDMISKAASTVGAFFSALSGKSTYTKAIAVQEDYAESLNGTAESAKKAQKYLSGLDEIKTFTEAETTSEAISAEDMFVEEEIDSPILSFADKIKEVIENIKALFKSEDWQGLGSLLADGLNKGIKKLFEILNVEKVKEKILPFVNGLTESFNSLVSNFDWKYAGTALSDSIKGLLDIVVNFIEGIDWQGLGKSVAEFIGSIDWNGLADRLFEGIGAVIGALAGFLWGLIEDAWNSVVAWWQEVAYVDGEFTMQGLLDGIWEKIKNIGAWLKEHVIDPFVNGFKKAFGIHSPSTVMAELGGFIMQGLINGITNLFNKFKSIFENIKNLVINIFNQIKEKITRIWNGIIDVIKGAINGIIGAINGLISGVINGINSMINALNGLSFDVPDWVPLIGGKKFGFDIPNLTAPQIPYLATGAVIPPNAPFMAMLGDQKHGTNIEAPLDTIKQAVREVVGDTSGGLYQFTAQINRRTLFEELIDEARLRQTTTGRNPFDLA